MQDPLTLLCRGWSVAIRLPPGWAMERRDSVVIARKSPVEGVFIEAVEKVAAYSLWEVAETAMRRNVTQGEPDRFPAVFAGHPAFGYEWTDGVQWVLTWWLELDPECCARVDYANGTVGRIREQADRLLPPIDFVRA